MKTALFVIGDYGSGKTTLIRALTGVGGRRTRKNNPYLLKVRSLGNRKIRVLAIKSALQEDDQTRYIPPQDFPEAFENVARYRVKPSEYDLLVCPLEISNKLNHKLNEYLQVFLSKGFDVRVAIIVTSWDNQHPTRSEILDVRNFVAANNLKVVDIDIFNSDEHLESRKMRDTLYP